MDKIIIFGDSIAYGQWYELGGWVARLRSYIDIKYNFPKKKMIQVFNLSVPGEIVTRMVLRMQDELSMRMSPDDKVLIIIACGINDSNPENKLAKKQTNPHHFKQALQQMMVLAEEANATIMFMGLTPVQDGVSGF